MVTDMRKVVQCPNDVGSRFAFIQLNESRYAKREPSSIGRLGRVHYLRPYLVKVLIALIEERLASVSLVKPVVDVAKPDVDHLLSPPLKRQQGRFGFVDLEA